MSKRFAGVIGGGLALLVLGAAACVQSPTVKCQDGRVCPAADVCDDAHGGCASPVQISECAGKAELAACSYQGTPDGACFDGVCLPAGCGNGSVNDPEVCDDGNRLHGDGCSADCLSIETCGNGFIDVVKGEGCDDANTIDGDGCQANCASPRCGDNVVDMLHNEACDQGTANSDAANATCRLNCQPKRCGDDILDFGEVCDDGNLAVKDGCTPDCLSNETCGNGYIDFLKGELCDDDNALSHDGCGACQPERGAWTAAAFGTPQSGAEVAYDVGRGRVVVVYGDSLFVETWEWDGWTWTDMTPAANNPPGRFGHAVAYDAGRKRVVLFGGRSASGDIADTWEWNGRVWRNVTPASGNPSGRRDHAIAYDVARERIVLFGGARTNIGRVADTWEWNGSTWSNITPASGNPFERDGHGLAYDPARGRVTLFGGHGNSGFLADTWHWDGIAWTNVTPTSNNPPGREGVALAYDPAGARIVMFGGSSGSGLHRNDTWEWSGSAWTDVTPAAGNPSPRENMALAYDGARRHVVMFGGSNNTGALGDLWRWSGVAWTMASQPASSPPARMSAAIAYDAARGQVVLFGGQDPDAPTTILADTWAWDGSSWRDVTPVSNNPPARYLHAAAYDAARRRVVVFGGFRGTALNDTWEWDGVTWTDVTPTSGNPPARFGHALAYDVARARVVLFGGYSGSFVNDTWEWNGTTWSNVTPASGNPEARSIHALAYDAARERVVLFGGNGVFSVRFSDTWEWNGTNWLAATPAVGSPVARYEAALAYDVARGRVVLFVAASWCSAAELETATRSVTRGRSAIRTRSPTRDAGTDSTTMAMG